MTRRTDEPANDNVAVITAAAIETGLYRVALAMERSGKKGEVYLPIYERLEVELAAMKEKESLRARARQRIKKAA